MELRVRADKAYFAIPCSNGEIHSLVLSLDGEAESSSGSHNFEEERVIAILGGQPSACAKVQTIYNTALTVFKAKYGIEDPDGLSKLSRDEYWKSSKSCFSCVSNSGSGGNSTLKHYSSISHQSDTNGVGDSQDMVARLVQWFERRQLFGVSNQSLVFSGELNYFSRYIIARGISVRSKIMLTPSFVLLAELFVGKNPKEIIALRKIATIQSLTQILDEIGRNKIISIGNKMARGTNNKNLGSMLLANRTVPTHIIIDFLKAGIYANIYTYYKNNATAHQALRVYNASNGLKTLKDYLSEGVSPRDAVLAAESRVCS